MASTFVQETIRRVTDKPVIRIPHAIDARLAKPVRRADFALPEKPFLFLFAFDFGSFAERKNPQAVMRAFRQSFAPDDTRVGLVIKCHNSSRHPQQWQALRALAAEDPRIRIIDRTLPRQAMLGLHSVCDAFVSLHRSEGLGLGMAEAMALGKPVIGTGYPVTWSSWTRTTAASWITAWCPCAPASTSTSNPGGGGRSPTRHRRAH